MILAHGRWTRCRGAGNDSLRASVGSTEASNGRLARFGRIDRSIGRHLRCRDTCSVLARSSDAGRSLILPPAAAARGIRLEGVEGRLASGPTLRWRGGRSGTRRRTPSSESCRLARSRGWCGTSADRSDTRSRLTSLVLREEVAYGLTYLLLTRSGGGGPIASGPSPGGLILCRGPSMPRDRSRRTGRVPR
jgi:hypothetical protein